jgi:hypothetical protein
MKKAQFGMGAMAFYGMILGITVWIAFSQLIGPAADATQDSRSISGLDCANASISTGTKGACVVTDWFVFGWAGAVIAGIIGIATGGFIGNKISQ